MTNLGFPILAIALVVSGCVTQPHKNTQQLSNLEQLQKYSRECWDSHSQSEPYKMVNEFLIQERSDPFAVTKMTLSRHATSSEKSLLRGLHIVASLCRDIDKTYSKHLGPLYQQYAEKWHIAEDTLLAQILNDKMTLGEANEIIYTRFSKQSEELNEIAQRLSYDSQRERELLLLESQSYSMPQPSQPTTTNCTSIGNTIRCRTD